MPERGDTPMDRRQLEEVFRAMLQEAQEREAQGDVSRNWQEAFEGVSAAGPRRCRGVRARCPRKEWTRTAPQEPRLTRPSGRLTPCERGSRRG